MKSKFNQLIALTEAGLKYKDEIKSHLLVELMQVTHNTDNVPFGGSIYMYGSGMDPKCEHNPPHFHFFTTSEKNENIGIDLITLEPTGLFNYGTSIKHPTKISNNVTNSKFKPFKRFLLEWLILPSKHNEDMTNYQMLGQIWNMNNPNLTQVEWKNLKISSTN